MVTLVPDITASKYEHPLISYVNLITNIICGLVKPAYNNLKLCILQLMISKHQCEKILVWSCKLGFTASKSNMWMNDALLLWKLRLPFFSRTQWKEDMTPWFLSPCIERMFLHPNCIFQHILEIWYYPLLLSLSILSDMKYDCITNR